MRKRTEDLKVKRMITRLARQLAALRDEIQRLAGAIPEPPDSVLEHRAPRTVEAETKGVLESIAHDLTEAVRSLERLAELTL